MAWTGSEVWIDAMVGQRLLHYEIIEKLGEGGMGVVYKARDQHLDRFVAIKLLRPERVTDASKKARFVQEAKAASSLNHPNIITIHDASFDVGHDFIAMEYIAGKTLGQIIPPKGMRLNVALRIAVQLADALHRAHTAGIIHRDLKPANIMVDSQGHAKVLDFGLAKLTETAGIRDDESTHTLISATEPGTIVGTMAYMSPEQAEGRALDARSDIFSFGALLYEMITGRQAFQGNSRMSTLMAILQEEPRPMDGTPPQLERIVKRCLQKDPERRFHHMVDLKVALQEFCEETSSNFSGFSRSLAARGRRRLLMGLVALPVLAAASWMAFTRIGDRSLPPRLVQLTSYPGSEMYPCFSPDGNEVAFTWDGEKHDNQDIYVKLVSETNALRLTTDPAPDLYPTWSPDGRRIAFQRNRPDTSGVWWVSPLGGAVQKIVDLPVKGQMSWSLDGRWIAVAAGSYLKASHDLGTPRGIFLAKVTGGETRRLSIREPPAYDHSPSFSPNGRQIAYASCNSTWSCDIFIQELDARYAPRGEARRVTREGRFIRGLAWSRGGESIIYSGALSWSQMRLRRVGRSGRQPSEALDHGAFGAWDPAISEKGGRLAFWRYNTDFDIWRSQLNGTPRPWPGSSSLGDTTPQFSPSGSRIAFASNRSGELFEIWAADADGSRQVQLAKGLGRGQGSPRWSPDGQLITFDSLEEDGRSQVYAVDARGGQPWRISSGPFNDAMPSFSRDGKWIYYFSNQSGRNEVWRAPTRGGPAEQTTEDGGETPLESADGRTLFYTKGEYSPLYARPASGGAERVVLEFVFRWSYVPFADGIFYIGRRGPDGMHPIQFYEFSSGASRLLFRVGEPLNVGLSVSPDRRTILFSKSATWGADLMMVDGFR